MDVSVSNIQLAVAFPLSIIIKDLFILLLLNHTQFVLVLKTCKMESFFFKQGGPLLEIGTKMIFQQAKNITFLVHASVKTYCRYHLKLSWNKSMTEKCHFQLTVSVVCLIIKRELCYFVPRSFGIGLQKMEGTSIWNCQSNKWIYYPISCKHQELVLFR